MPKSHGDSIKLVCPNKGCINKSAVWRRFDVLKEYTCKACNGLLVQYKPLYALHQDRIAKQELGAG